MKNLRWKDNGAETEEPVRRLLAIGWSGIKNAINEAIEIPEVFDQSAKMNVLNMLRMTFGKNIST